MSTTYSVKGYVTHIFAPALKEDERTSKTVTVCIDGDFKLSAYGRNHGTCIEVEMPRDKAKGYFPGVAVSIILSCDESHVVPG